MTPPPGPLSVNIEVENAAGIGSEPEKVLKEGLKKFADDLFAVATIYERRFRGNSSTQVQFTTAHISDAYSEVRRTGARLSRSSRLTAFALRLLLYIAAAGIGVGGNNLTTQWGTALFWASLTGGLIMVGIFEARGWKGDE